MRRLVIAFALGALVAAGDSGLRAQRSGPTLLVVLVVDQLRAADIGLYDGRWRRGFRTLLDQGAYFTRAAYPYLHTATCSGHATISTGTLPSTHGIILNRWWHRTEQRSFNCMDDDGAPNVSFGKPSSGGNSAKRLLVPTLGDELRTQQPGARVVSVSLKPRSAITLAGHGGDVVLWFDEGARSFVTSRAFASEPVPGVRRFIGRDAPEAALGTTWALEKGERYRNADIKAAERPKAGWTAVFPHPLAGNDGADGQFFDRWQKSPLSDAYLSRLALALVDDLELGRRAQTDYLAISFSALDLLGHDFGPDSREAEDLLIQLDRTLGALIEGLDQRLGADRYVVALTSDHGVAPVPEQVGGGRIASEDVHQVLEQTLVSAWGSRDSPYVSWVGPGSVYFADGVFDRLRADAPALDRVLDALLSIPGVARVLRVDRLDGGGSDPLLRAARAGYSPSRSGDLLIVAHRHWIYELRSEFDATNHGTFHDYDRRVPILMRGAGVRQGRYSSSASPADVAPTLAHLAGVRLPKAEGRVLSEALDERAR